MPFTFFAHQTAVLPLKWLRPRWFDGTALCIGSMAPDFAYALESTPFAIGSHTLPQQLTWTLPVTLAMTWLVRRTIALPLGSNLPRVVTSLGEQLRALSASRPSWPRTTLSALLGGASHVFMDGFTHQHGWAVAHWSTLKTTLQLPGIAFPLWKLLQYIGHTAGTLLGVLMVTLLIRGRYLTTWLTPTSAPPPLPSTPLLFWLPIAITTTLAIPLTIHLLNHSTPINVAVIRAALLIATSIQLAALTSQHSAAR